LGKWEPVIYTILTSTTLESNMSLVRKKWPELDPFEERVALIEGFLQDAPSKNCSQLSSRLI